MRGPAHGGGTRVDLRRGIVLAAAILAVGGCGGSTHRNSATHGDSGAASPPLSVTAPLRPAHPQTPPGLRHLRFSLRRALRRAGKQTGLYVYDLTAQRTLYALHAAQKRAPASVEKLYTTVAALRLMGPAARLDTTVLGTGELGAHGVWHGNLYLRGGGDPTLGDGGFNRTFEQGYGPTALELAQQLRAHGIRRISGRLIGDGSLFSAAPGGPATGYGPDIPDFGGELGALAYDHGSTLRAHGPAAFAARELAKTLRRIHVHVRAAPDPAPAPPGARPLASVASPPLSVLLRLMDVPSDDLFAEMLTEGLGARFAGDGTIPAGARVIANQIQAGYGVFPRIVDGSGLSRDDASSPLEVVQLLREVWHTPVGTTLAQALPVAGVSGTIATLGRASPAVGHCLAKTGTLDQVTNLAGYCTAQGHHTLAFAVFIDGPQNWVAYPMLSAVMAALARY